VKLAPARWRSILKRRGKRIWKGNKGLSMAGLSLSVITGGAGVTYVSKLLKRLDQNDAGHAQALMLACKYRNDERIYIRHGNESNISGDVPKITRNSLINVESSNFSLLFFNNTHAEAGTLNA
jgi:hypothetical protein